MKKMLPVGLDDFKEIIEQGFYYVDKTGMIKELLENWGKVNLFTRPRRFGKSLNMSMLKAFFEIGTDASLFDGLAISKEDELRNKYMGLFPVISISLKQVAGNSFAESIDNLRTIVSMEAKRFTFLMESATLDEDDKWELRKIRRGECNLDASLYMLSKLLQKHYGKKVIILIDEYDAPLQKAYEYGYYDEMVRFIRQFFGYALKTNDALFFSALTGCMRIARESIFSDLNNLKIHSISDERFDEWFGFTDEETVQMLNDLGLAEYYDATKEWYDGYRFGDQDVYCPWDVINWCDQLLNTSDRIPRNYWVNSGGTDIIRQFAEKADSTTRDQIGILIEGGTVRKNVTQEFTYRDVAERSENIWNLLYTSGYLTQHKRHEDGSYEMMIPNHEVRNIFIEQINNWFKDSVLEDADGLKEFYDALIAGDADAMEDCLNFLLGQSISFLDGGKLKDKENFYHGLLLGMLQSRRGWEITSNREAGKGRPDITAYNLRGKDAYILEVKYCRDEDDLMEAAQEALKQIRDNKYDQFFRVRQPKSIRHFGIAFCKKLCKVMVE